MMRTIPDRQEQGGESARVTIYIGLLRGVNVGGHRSVAMGDLRNFAAELGLGEARTLLQSGNLVFRSAGKTTAQLERLLEAEAAKRLGLETDFFVRTEKEWGVVVAGNPFPEEAERDPAHLLVMVFKKNLDATAVRALQAAITGPEVVRSIGREAFFVYPEGIGRSRLTGPLIERTLGARSTARNWKTVRKLEALANG